MKKAEVKIGVEYWAGWRGRVKVIRFATKEDQERARKSGRGWPSSQDTLLVSYAPNRFADPKAGLTAQKLMSPRELVSTWEDYEKQEHENRVSRAHEKALRFDKAWVAGKELLYLATDEWMLKETLPKIYQALLGIVDGESYRTMDGDLFDEAFRVAGVEVLKAAVEKEDKKRRGAP